MHDVLMTLGNSQIQHGPNSKRVYLMSLDRTDLPEICTRIEELARKNLYTKIFAKVPVDVEQPFLERGYRREASVPGYYRGRLDASFLGYYLDSVRKTEPKEGQIRDVLTMAQAKANTVSCPLSEEFVCREFEPSELDNLAGLYRKVFATYPFPIHDEAYLRETQRSHVSYFGIWWGEELIAAASAEVDKGALVAELTDFATDPAFAGRGLASHLLESLLQTIEERNLRTAMTIARALSPGMNAVFARCGFEFSGTLCNNTGICGTIESMNVWHKALK